MFWKNEYFLIILLVLVWLAGYVFLRPDFVGTDSYIYLNVICNQGAVVSSNHGLLWSNVLSFLPCNFVSLKIILAFLLLLSLFGLLQIGKLYFKERGLWVVWLIFSSPLFYWFFLDLEGAQFAFPLLIWSLFFVLKGKEQGVFGLEIVGLILTCFAGLLWHGSYLWLIGLGFISLPSFIVFVLSLPFFWQTLFASILPRFDVLEALPIIGVIYLFFLVIGVVGAWKMNKLWLITLFFFVLGAINGKLMLFCVPFLAIGMTYLTLNRPLEKKWLIALFPVLVILMILWGLPSYAPNSQQVQAIKQGIVLSGSDSLNNDWSYGYWINFYGGQGKSLNAEGCPIETKWFGLVLSDQNGLTHNCKQIKAFLWDCR